MITTAAMISQTRDPLVLLPYETWLKCLSLAIHDFATGPLAYLAVSPDWSETILNSPTLWTQIIIDDGEDEEARLHIFLHLSASQLLDVSCMMDGPTQSMQLLAQNRMRIRSLVVEPSMEYRAAQFWRYLGNPKMQHVCFMSWNLDPGIQALILSCPNLKSLKCDVYIKELMLPATVEEVKIDIHSLIELRALYPYDCLRSLTLRRNIYPLVPEPAFPTAFSSPIRNRTGACIGRVYDLPIIYPVICNFIFRNPDCVHA
jgi:hypothetical protein